MVEKVPGVYWTDEEIKEAIEEWKKKKPERLKTGEWRVEDVPFYEPGLPPRADLWHRVDYLDEVELIWDKPWGASGIGKLREAAVCRPTEWDIHMFEKQDPVFMNRPKLPNLGKWQQEHDNYFKVLRENGVTVHYIEYPDPPIGGYGPIRGCWATCEAKVIWGGALITRYGGWSPLSRGREVTMTKFLANQGCPILHTITGKGVLETGPINSLADDVMVVHRGIAGNEDGVNQIRPVLERADITHLIEAQLPSWLEENPWPGKAIMHLDMLIGVLDTGKVLLEPTLCGWELVQWLRDHRFEIIVPEPSESELFPANLTTLEPGKVIMIETARKTIQKVKKAGVEVIEIPFAEAGLAGGGIDCATLQMIRDRGPKLEDIK